MAQVPDAGAHATDGRAFNGEVGQGLAERLIATISRRGASGSICDLGCGNGYLAGRLGALGFSVLGVDAAPSYVETARRHHASERVTFTDGMIDAALAGKILATHPPFDLVVSSEVIEHMYNPADLLTTAMAILRPGGVAVISTPYHGYLKNVAISILDRWDDHHGVHWHGGHIKFFSPASLGGMMRQAGFREPEFDFYGRFPGFWKNQIAVATRPETTARS